MKKTKRLLEPTEIYRVKFQAVYMATKNFLLQLLA